MNSIHHVTAIAGKARRNLDFYTSVLGLRLVKRTINFDDPGTYHFYFGDEAGNPGTLITFFPWEQAAPGRAGAGQVEETSFRIPEGSLGFWMHRLLEFGVPHSPVAMQFGRKVLRFQDFDGTNLSLVAAPGAERDAAWSTPGVANDVAIRCIESVTMTVQDPRASAAILTDLFGFDESEVEDGVACFRLGNDCAGSAVLLRSAQEIFNGMFGRGSVHHVAFRTRDDEEQAALADKLLKNHGIRTTPQRDRTYFRSVYFNEPGGVIFEIATDGPGFTTDETIDSLGSELRIPPQFESRRADIERTLPEL